MIVPLIRIGALKLGAEFETSLTKRKGCILERVAGSPGVIVQFEDEADEDLTQILHQDVKVRPVSYVH